MTAHWLIAATCLAAAAAVLAWPQRSRPARLLTSSRPAARSLRARVESLSGPRALILAVALAALAGTLLAGPVTGVVAGGYGAIAVRTVLRRRSSRALAAMRTRSLDALCGLAADLRAGLAVGGPASVESPTAGSTPVHSPLGGDASLGDSADPAMGPAAIEDRRMAQLAGAAWRLAERTGAPIADLVERIEADARAMDRASAAAAAQAAGARATAWLLAGLPLGGIALGYSIGADPLAVLLHTPIGAACALSAIALQIAGLAWADRIASAGTARPEPTPPPPAQAAASGSAPAPTAAPPPARAVTVASGATPAPIGSPWPAAVPPPGRAVTVASGATPASTAAPGAATTASGSAPAPWPAAASPPRPAVPAAPSATPAPTAVPRSMAAQAPGAARTTKSAATAGPLRTPAETTPLPRAAIPARPEAAGAARGAGQSKPHPLPRAAASQSSAGVADQSGLGSYS